MAQYNAGAKTVLNVLNDCKAKGMDIYGGLEWINELPEEPRNYVKFILLGENTGPHRNMDAFNKSKTQGQQFSWW